MCKIPNKEQESYIPLWYRQIRVPVAKFVSQFTDYARSVVDAKNSNW